MAQGAISSDIEVPKNANRYPAYIFYLIALVALIMLGAEVAGYLGGNGTKMAILFGVTILALIERCSFMLFFAAAMVCYCAGAVFTFGAMFGFLPESEWTLGAGQLGTAALAILFFMAQEFRIRPKASRN